MIIETFYDERIFTLGLIKDGLLLNKDTFSKPWIAVACLSLSDKCFVLCLENENKNQAVWYFNSQCEYIGNDLDSIFQYKPIYKDSIVLFYEIFFTSFLKEYFSQECLVESQYSLLLNRGFLYNQLNKCFEYFCYRNDFHESCFFDFLNVEGRDVQDLHLLSDDSFVSFDDFEYPVFKCNKSIVINNGLVAYPYKNQVGDLIIVFEAGHYNKRVFLIDTLDVGFFLANKREVEPLNSLRIFLFHLVNYFDLIKKYLYGKIRKKSVLLRSGSHIGHSLWNDLTGVDRLLSGSTKKNFDEFIVLNADSSEPWGKYEDIFESQGVKSYLIDRTIVASNLSKHIYTEKIFLVRLSDCFISEKLTQRIIVENNKKRSKEINKLEVDNFLVVVFGLRFENRTWINQLEGWIDVVKYLQTKSKNIKIIVDGHDTVGDSNIQFKSHMESDSHDLISLEKGVVNRLTSEFGEDVIVDSVLNNISDAIGLINMANFFIAPWGAGLAKYQWLCNKPGIVFTSSFNYKNKGDLHIYDSNKYREGANSAIWVPPRYIIDNNSVESVINIPGNAPTRNNFYLDIDGLKLAIDEMLYTSGFGL